MGDRTLERGKGGGRPLCLGMLLLLLVPQGAHAYSILFYYSSNDAFSSALLKAVTVLQNAGNTVTKIDVGGAAYNPSGDAWGSYDQVWDMRFNNVQSGCGTGSAASFDYFTANWRTKSVSYLNNCGRLFLISRFLPTLICPLNSARRCDAI